jgi:ubiquinone biosynthesis protein COQ9
MKKARDTRDVPSKILAAALRDAAFDGWTDDMLHKAAKRAGVSEDAAHDAFPEGVLGLVLYFSEWADGEMLKKLPPKKLASMRVRDKVTAGVRARLEILGPHREAVAKSLSFLARPPRNIHLPKLVWRTADHIWRAAGDTATDYNHYTKRILLSGVLTATTLFWLNDDSDGREKTWDFLDSRIGEVLKIGQFVGQVAGRAGGKFRARK